MHGINNQLASWFPVWQSPQLRVTSAMLVKNGFVILQGHHVPPFFCVLTNFFIIS